ncbi:hypothetical protein [Pseudonocardia spinosispora]|uniref:hypothetical protein n=1 Tax=Pseudonocardia spinosispora TaxID=103441 RepID=UPI00048B4BC2|nr:hypothetical protein [Pseudonocardia spinosispora]
MNEIEGLLQHLTSEGFLITYFTAAAVFGFAPGFFLRAVVLPCYPKEHPRRQELAAELYAVPRLRRWFWVLEQFETGLFDGLNDRVRRRSKTRRHDLKVVVLREGQAVRRIEITEQSLTAWLPRHPAMYVESIEGPISRRTAREIARRRRLLA